MVKGRDEPRVGSQVHHLAVGQDGQVAGEVVHLAADARFVAALDHIQGTSISGRVARCGRAGRRPRANRPRC